MIVNLARGIRTTLTIALEGDALPSEFRIFRSGENETTKGTFLFDSDSAASVMSEYEAHGIDVMLDYDHASLDTLASRDPAQAGKAAGWCRLEVRAGELWAVNVRWTEHAADALRAKEWRYMSPAFAADREGRIVSLLNVAITNLPATRRLEPLVAASIGGGRMNPDTAKKALDLVEAADAEGALALLKEILAESVAEEAPEAPAEEVPVEEAPVEEPAPEMMSDAPADEDKAAVMAATSRLVRLTGKETIGAAVEEVEVWRASHLKLEAETKKLAQERAALEASERDALTVEIALATSPAVAWADPLKATERAKRKPAEPFASMSIGDLRAFAKRLGAARAVRPQPVPPAKADAVDGGERVIETPHGAVSLSASELAECARANAKPEVYAANKARRLSRGK